MGDVRTVFCNGMNYKIENDHIWIDWMHKAWTEKDKTELGLSIITFIVCTNKLHLALYDLGAGMQQR